MIACCRAGCEALSCQHAPGAESRSLGADSRKVEVSMLLAHFTTSEGKFTARLFDAEVPNTVANFTGLADGSKEWTDPRSGRKVSQPYFNGTVFHRVIDGFMIQGGDPLGQGTGGPGFTFADEFHPKLRHSKAGMLSMAERGPDTNRRRGLPAP